MSSFLAPWVIARASFEIRRPRCGISCPKSGFPALYESEWGNFSPEEPKIKQRRRTINPPSGQGGDSTTFSGPEKLTDPCMNCQLSDLGGNFNSKEGGHKWYWIGTQAAIPLISTLDVGQIRLQEPIVSIPFGTLLPKYVESELEFVN